MGVRTGSLIMIAVAGVAVIARAGSQSPGSPASPGAATRTQVTIWATPPPADESYGGLAYGGYAPTTGALITEQHEIDVAGEARISGVAATLDPASVQLRDLTDPGAQIADQRFLPAAATPTEILSRHLGESVTVTTPRGDATGALRAVDDQVIVVEIGGGDQRHLQVMRRDSYVQDIRLAAGAASDPVLAWRMRTTRPGRHTVELSYRADGMSWSADYVAVLDEPGRALELSARATIRNATGASYEAVDLTLVGIGPESQPGTHHPPPARFRVPAAVRIGRGESVLVELAPHRSAVPVRSVILFEAMPDPSPRYQTAPGIDCTQFGAGGAGTGHGDVAIELDVPPHTALPDGKVRLFQRRAGRLEVVSEEPLRRGAGVARIRVAPDPEITGDRRGVTCNADEQSHTLRETVEVTVENRGHQAADAVIREYLWRWPVWHIETEDHKGVRGGPQLQEYRVRVPGGGKQVVTYTAVYAW